MRWPSSSTVAAGWSGRLAPKPRNTGPRHDPVHRRADRLQFALITPGVTMSMHILAMTPPVALSSSGLVTYLQTLFGPLFLGIVGIVAIFFLFTREILRFVQFFVLAVRSEEHTSELQSRQYLVCRLLLEKKKKSIAT